MAGPRRQSSPNNPRAPSARALPAPFRVFCVFRDPFLPMRNLALIFAVAFSAAISIAAEAAPANATSDTSRWVKFTAFNYQPKPVTGTAPAPTANVAYSDNFDSDTLAPQWTALRPSSSHWFATSKAAKALYLQPRADRLLDQGDP